MCIYIHFPPDYYPSSLSRLPFLLTLSRFPLFPLLFPFSKGPFPLTTFPFLLSLSRLPLRFPVFPSLFLPAYHFPCWGCVALNCGALHTLKALQQFA